VILAIVVWMVSVLGAAAAARLKGGLSSLEVLGIGKGGTGLSGEEECAEPPTPVPPIALGQVAENTGTVASPPPVPLAPPALPVIGPPFADLATSSVPKRLPEAKVARSGPSTELLRPVAPATAEPPLVEAISAKPPSREDNIWRGEPMLATPPHRREASPLTLGLWADAGGKNRIRCRKTAGKNDGLFVGTFVCKLDEHKGLILPQQASDQMGLPRHVYVTPGPADCLWLCNATALERLTDRLVPDTRRLYLAQTERVSVDSCGRIALPEAFGPLACMRQDVVLLGVGDHFELWDSERLQRYVDQKPAWLHK
jgi:MraZ protein